MKWLNRELDWWGKKQRDRRTTDRDMAGQINREKERERDVGKDRDTAGQTERERDGMKIRARSVGMVCLGNMSVLGNTCLFVYF